MLAPLIPSDFLETLPEPVFLFGGDSRLGYINQNAKSLLSVLGLGDSRDITYARFCRNLDLRGGAHAEDHVIIEDKHYRVLQSTTQDYKIIRFFPAQENLHLLRLSYSLDIMPWGLVTVDVSGKKPIVLYGNSRAGQFLNVPERELFGEDAHVLFSGLGEWPEIQKRLFSSQKSTYGFEIFINGRHIWYNLHFTPYVRKTMYCLVVIEDATEEKIMEGQYISAQRLEALGKLAGGVAHDFNNILSIIDGYARIARKNAHLPEKVVDCGEKIANSVQRGAALTQKLLAFGRQKETTTSVFNLGRMVMEQEALLRPLLDASIQLVFDVEEDVFIAAGHDDVAQILMNLCVNSRDAMPDGGSISVTVKKKGGGGCFIHRRYRVRHG
jgi:signal transduction histidine kinase